MLLRAPPFQGGDLVLLSTPFGLFHESWSLKTYKSPGKWPFPWMVLKESWCLSKCVSGSEDSLWRSSWCYHMSGPLSKHPLLVAPFLPGCEPKGSSLAAGQKRLSDAVSTALRLIFRDTWWDRNLYKWRKWRSRDEGFFSLYRTEPRFELRTAWLKSPNREMLGRLSCSLLGVTVCYLSLRVMDLWTPRRLAALQFPTQGRKL